MNRMPDHGAPRASPEVDAVLAVLPDASRLALEQLRRTIRDAAPEAVEGISYGVPAFKYHGRPVVAFGAAKNHCAFYIQSPAVMEAHADELAGHDTSRGTVRFQPGAPLPPDLVTMLVRARMAETDAAAG
jgi:uncharacterized protein YdhG (YjbR/CyaY superfamily)